MTSRRSRRVHGEVLLDGAQRRRKESRERRILWWRIGTAVGALSLMVGLATLYFSPALRVQNVEVRGGGIVSSQEVAEMIDLEGDPIFRVDTGAIAEQVMTLPAVHTVSVERDWPQTVRIEITERAAWGYWKTGGNMYPIDAEGVVLAGVEPPEGAVVVEHLGQPAALSRGDQVDKDAISLTRALLEQAPAVVGAQVGAIEYSEKTGLSVETSAGYRVIIGDSQNLEYKLAVWKALEEELGPQGMAGQVLDLRFGDRPSLRGGDES